MKDLNDFQHLFNTDLDKLKEQEEDSIQFIEQNHFGDLLIESIEEGNERFKLWRNLDENVEQGESLIEIEHSGKNNNWTWETIFKYEIY